MRCFTALLQVWIDGLRRRLFAGRYGISSLSREKFIQYMVSSGFGLNYFCNGECLENCCGAELAASKAAQQLFTLLIDKRIFCEISVLIVVS